MELFSNEDFAQVQESAKRLGLSHVELYAESSSDFYLFSRDKVSHESHFHACGLSFKAELSQDGVTRRIHTSSLSVEKLIAKLRGETTPHSSLPELKMAPLVDSSNYRSLQDLVRRWNGAGELSSPVQLSWRGRKKYFQVAHESGSNGSGSEEQISLELKWTTNCKAIPMKQSSYHRSSQENFFRDLPLDSIDERLLLHKRLVQAWPAPHGELPLLWQPTALAKILTLVLPELEGDHFLNGLNTRAARERESGPGPFEPLAFDLVETSEQNSKNNFDHEGTGRRNLTFMQAGKLRAVAYDNALAKTLEQSATGHGRRESFNRPISIALWSLQVRPLKLLPNPLSKMDWGMNIRDLEIDSFDPEQLKVRLKILDARLIHQGEEGESVIPFYWSLPLPTLLRSLQYFDKTIETLGVIRPKGLNRLLTEIQTASAVSDPLLVPGEVPLQTYW